MSGKFNTQLATIDSALMKTIELAKKYGSEEYQDENLYANSIHKICLIHEKAKRASDIIQSTGQLSTVNEIETIIENATKKKINVKNTTKYKVLKKQIHDFLAVPTGTPTESLSNRCLDDDISVQAGISAIDPITKRIIEHPVKNKICNHRYEKTSIMELIQQSNPGLRCPVVGCGNKYYITANVLEDDYEFLQEIQRTQNS